MSLYIETIRLLDGALKNIRYHQERFERTRSHSLGVKSHPQLEQLIQIPDGLEIGLLKCRVIYGKEIQRIEFEPYERRLVSSVKLIVSESILYNYKFAERSALDLLFSRRGACDEIMIVKNGCITDSYYANVAFWDGSKWFTPDTPLLPGTMRASLLDEGVLETRRITVKDLGEFQKLKLINAMNNLHEGPDIPIDALMY